MLDGGPPPCSPSSVSPARAGKGCASGSAGGGPSQAAPTKRRTGNKRREALISVSDDGSMTGRNGARDRWRRTVTTALIGDAINPSNRGHEGPRQYRPTFPRTDSTSLAGSYPTPLL